MVNEDTNNGFAGIQLGGTTIVPALGASDLTGNDHARDNQRSMSEAAHQGDDSVRAVIDSIARSIGAGIANAITNGWGTHPVRNHASGATGHGKS